MCGIAGFASARSIPALDRRFLSRVAAEMRHRGPDGEGTWEGEGVGLTHRRLSVIDLTGGTQPMSYPERRLRISFNGEIYNYRELREELKSAGHLFRTRSDTEVVLAAYAEWGSAAPRRLRGIFAFAIWDESARRLFLARDHLGVKPLFYALGSGWVVFASELKAMLEAECISRDVDRQALTDYLALGYVLGEKTVIRAVRRLPPGSFLNWSDGRERVERFWRLDAGRASADQSPVEDETLVGDFARKLEEAVRFQMVSDVPVGAFLSGGLDSSTIVEQMRAHTERRPLTFSMGFKEGSFSELDYARRTATALGTEHHEEVVRAELADDLPTLVRSFDEPLGDTSIVPTFFVSRLARRHVKVVLSGDGADETLAGYDTYVADALQRAYVRVPGLVHRQLLLPASRLIPHSRRKVSLNYRLRQFVAQAHAPLERAHYGWRLLFERGEQRSLLGAEDRFYDPFDSYATYFDAAAGADDLNRCLYVDINTWLAGDILPKVDRASMAVGLEARVPFLDHELVELAMRLPRRLKMRGLQRKVVLRRVMRDRLPRAVLRRSKRGFNAPVSDWLRRSLRPVVEDLLRAPSSLVDTSDPALDALWRGHLAGDDYGYRLWALVVLLVWERHVLRHQAHSRTDMAQMTREQQS